MMQQRVINRVEEDAGYRQHLALQNMPPENTATDAVSFFILAEWPC